MCDDRGSSAPPALGCPGGVWTEVIRLARDSPCMAAKGDNQPLTALVTLYGDDWARMREVVDGQSRISRERWRFRAAATRSWYRFKLRQPFSLASSSSQCAYGRFLKAWKDGAASPRWVVLVRNHGASNYFLATITAMLHQDLTDGVCSVLDPEPKADQQQCSPRSNQPTSSLCASDLYTSDLYTSKLYTSKIYTSKLYVATVDTNPSNEPQMLGRRLPQYRSPRRRQIAAIPSEGMNNACPCCALGQIVM